MCNAENGKLEELKEKKIKTVWVLGMCICGLSYSRGWGRRTFEPSWDQLDDIVRPCLNGERRGRVEREHDSDQRESGRQTWVQSPKDFPRCVLTSGTLLSSVPCHLLPTVQLQLSVLYEIYLWMVWRVFHFWEMCVRSRGWVVTMTLDLWSQFLRMFMWCGASRLSCKVFRGSLFNSERVSSIPIILQS